MKYMLSISIVFLMVSSGIASEKIYVRRDHFECVLTKLDDYLSQTSHQIVVFLEECPVTDLIAILQRRTQNSALPDVKKQSSSPERPAEVLLISRDQLRCLSRLEFNSNDEVVEISFDICGNEIR